MKQVHFLVRVQLESLVLQWDVSHAINLYLIVFNAAQVMAHTLEIWI